MKVIQDIFSDEIADFAVQTIGFFDGVHKGHQYLLDQVKNQANRLGLKSMVITFRNHPSKVLSPDRQVPLLTTTAEKLHLLENNGIDYVVLLDFNEKLSMMSAYDFMSNILVGRLKGKALVIGYDHHFGHPKENEGFAEYQQQGKSLGLEVILAKELPKNTTTQASSTAIRKALAEGNIQLANLLLNHPYSIEGKVGHGEGIGHKLGFPTANIIVDDSKILPKDSAYAVKVHIGKESFAGMLYIGSRPTFEGLLEKRVEVNILDFNEEIYDKTIRVDFIDFLRGEQHFDSPEDLKIQLEKDCNKIRTLIQ